MKCMEPLWKKSDASTPNITISDQARDLFSSSIPKRAFPVFLSEYRGSSVHSQKGRHCQPLWPEGRSIQSIRQQAMKLRYIPFPVQAKQILEKYAFLGNRQGVSRRSR